MQLANIKTRSHNFIGKNDLILQDVKEFLSEIKQTNKNEKEFNLVHALVFSKEMSEGEVLALNNGLSDVYKACGFHVLGGDTSSGVELSIFISTIVF